MIYVGKVKPAIMDEPSKLEIIDFFEQYQPQQFDVVACNIKELKTEQAKGFISGTMKALIRNNSNLVSRDCLVLDLDDVEVTKDELIESIESKFKKYQYVLYPSISNGVKGVRYRLLLPLNDNVDAQDYKLLIDFFSRKILDDVIGRVDESNQTWSQIMLLPCLTAYNSLDDIHINSSQQKLPVNELINMAKEWRKLEQPKDDIQAITLDFNHSEQLSNEQYIKLFNSYSKRNRTNLNNYAFYLNAYMCLKHGVQSGEITEDIAKTGLMILAGDNREWQVANVKHFEQDKGISKLKKPVRDFFDSSDSKGLVEGIELQETLQAVRETELSFMLKKWEENDKKGRKPSVISPIRVAYLLNEHAEFCLFDMNENTKLAVYRPKEGIYTQNETYIRRMISWLEPKHNSSKASDVIYHLKNMAKVRERTVSRYLIPVNNGVFNLKTHQLEPFSHERVFTSKIATNYIDNPINPIIDGWKVDDWMKSISCNDPEIERLLWQVISASLNGNFSRRKSIWLVGSGNNGKGTYQALIKNLVGAKNVATLKLPDFQGRFNLSMLEEKTVCIGDDVPAGFYIDDSSNFNSVVTGDDVMVEEKNKPAYSTNFQMTVIQSTNGMPKIHNKTEGTYRRIVIVPFSANFKGQGDNWKIKDEYIKNKSVLEYVLYQAINLDFERFTIPKESENLMSDYRQVNDPLVDFKENVFNSLNLNKIPFYIVYGYYKDFCHDNNFQPMSKIKFSKEFESLLGDGWSKYSKKYSKGEINNLPNKPYNIDYPSHGKTYMYYINERLKVM